MVSLCGSYSDDEASDLPTTDGDVAADAEDTIDSDSETEHQSSDDGDDDAGDIDELLDEALDQDAEDSSIHTDSKSSVTTDSAAAIEPVSCKVK